MKNTYSEVKIVDDIAASVGWKRGLELLICSLVGDLLDNDLSALGVNAEDGVFVLVAHLDGVEGGNHLISDCDSGCHFECIKVLRRKD